MGGFIRFVAVLVCVVGGWHAAYAWQTTVGSGGYGQAYTVRLDAVGDVFAAGANQRAGVSIQRSFTVAKLAGSSGRVLWTKTITPAGTGTYEDAGLSLQVDAAGDVVAGGAAGGQFAVVKLAGADGAERWRYTLSVGGVSSVALDSSGDVIAAGGVGISGGSGNRFTVVKLAGADGAELWHREIPGTDLGNIYGGSARAVRVGASGDAFVGGAIADSGTKEDITVLRLAGTDGSTVWQTTLDGDQHEDDALSSLALDPAGDVLVGGGLTTGPSPARYAAVVKLAGSDGTEAWRSTASDTGTVTALAVDPSGDVFATRNNAFVVARLSGLTGVESWAYTEFGYYPAGDVGIDAEGRVVAVGGYPTFSIVRLAASNGARISSQWLGSDERSASGAALALDGVHVVAAGYLITPNLTQFTVVKLNDGLAGRAVVIRDPGPAGRILQVDSKDPELFVSAHSTPLSAPSPSDPTGFGATVEVTNPTTAQSLSIVLPASRWKALKLRKLQAYTYADPQLVDGPCYKAALQSANKLSLRCRGAQLGAVLGGNGLDEIDVRVTIGAPGSRYCFAFGGTIQQDTTQLFKAVKSPRPATCQ